MLWSHLIVPGYNYVRPSKQRLVNSSLLSVPEKRKLQRPLRLRQTMELLDARGVSCYLANVCDWKVEAPDVGSARERSRAGVDWMSIEDYFISTLKAGA